MSKNTVISVKNLQKSFEGRKVVDNISFDVAKGEVFGLLGHNGAGKSTIIDLILGLKIADGGCAEIFEKRAARNRKDTFETKSMNVATSVLYFPMLLFSGATIPAEVFPKGLRVFADIMPLGVGINLLKSISRNCCEGLFTRVIVLLAICVICTGIAVKTFRWE